MSNTDTYARRLTCEEREAALAAQNAELLNHRERLSRPRRVQPRRRQPSFPTSPSYASRKTSLRRRGTAVAWLRSTASPRTHAAANATPTKTVRPTTHGRTASHGARRGQAKPSPIPASGDDPPGERAPAHALSGARTLHLRDRATTIAFRFLIEKSLTDKDFFSLTKGFSPDERRRVETLLPPEAQTALAADRKAVAS